MLLLTDLPEELLSIIVYHASRGARQNLRLTSKLFDRLASPLIWDRIWISSHPLDLDVFKRVTSSRFASNIRELVWDDTTFQRPLLAWRDFVYVSENGHQSRRGARYSPTRGAFEKWCEIATAHHQIRATRLDQEALNEALPRLTNLKRIVITNRNVEPIPHEDEVPEFGSSPTVRQWKQWEERVPFPPSICWYDDSHEATDPLGELFDPDYLDDALTELSFRGALENARPFRGLTIMLHALDAQRARSGKLGIEEFIIRPSYEPGTMSEPGISCLFFSRRGIHMTRMASIFAGLRVLNLVISNGRNSNDGYKIMRKGYMTNVLSSARSIEDLTLEMDSLPILTVFPPTLEERGALDSSHKHENLKKVSFLYGRFNAEPLVRFLRNHGNVLQEVQFYKCRLRSAYLGGAQKTWLDILQDVKTEKLRFRRFILEDCSVTQCPYYFDNIGRASDEIRKYVEGDGAMPVDVNTEKRDTARFSYYDRYY